MIIVLKEIVAGLVVVGAFAGIIALLAHENADVELVGSPQTCVDVAYAVESGDGGMVIVHTCEDI